MGWMVSPTSGETVNPFHSPCRSLLCCMFVLIDPFKSYSFCVLVQFAFDFLLCSSVTMFFRKTLDSFQY